jgi:hypothetical protein
LKRKYRKRKKYPQENASLLDVVSSSHWIRVKASIYLSSHHLLKNVKIILVLIMEDLSTTSGCYLKIP